MTPDAPVVSAERRAQIARSNRRLGIGVSAFGAALLVVAAVLVAATGVVATVRAGDDPDDVAAQMSALGSIVPILLMFFAFCALMFGEQARRGELMRNPAPPQTVLPQASVVSRFRMLSVRWHALWIGVAAACALLLLGPVAAGLLFGVWPHTLPTGALLQGLWSVQGAFAAATAVVLAQSLVKKVVTLRAVVAGRHDSTHRKGWRFWLYRWRVDSWLTAVGGFALALFGMFGLGAALDGDTAAPVLLALAGAGVVWVAAGVVLGIQFWRTGEDLGAGESYA